MFLSPIKGTALVVTQQFGERPGVYKQFGLAGHNGVDMRAPVGTPLYSPITGIATIADQGNRGYGKYVRIRNDHYEVVLAHLSRFEVKNGQEVKLGDPVGFSGNTGFSTAPHLHFGIRKVKDGQLIDQNNGYSGYVDHLPYILVWVGKLK